MQARCGKSAAPLARPDVTHALALALAPRHTLANMRNSTGAGSERDAAREFCSLPDSASRLGALLLSVSVHTRVGDWGGACDALLRALQMRPVSPERDLAAEHELAAATTSVMQLLLAACADARSRCSQRCELNALTCAQLVRALAV